VALLNIFAGSTTICSESEKIEESEDVKEFKETHDGRNKNLSGFDFRKTLYQNFLTKVLNSSTYWDDFSGSNLSGANFSGLDLTDITFDNAEFDEKTDFRDSLFYKIKKSMFFSSKEAKASLRGVKNLKEAQLKGACFSIVQVNAHLKKLSERNDQVSYKNQLDSVKEELGIKIVDMPEEFD